MGFISIPIINGRVACRDRASDGVGSQCNCEGVAFHSQLKVGQASRLPCQPWGDWLEQAVYELFARTAVRYLFTVARTARRAKCSARCTRTGTPQRGVPTCQLYSDGKQMC